MRSLSGILFIAASIAFGAGIPQSHVYGEYVEARNADVYTGTCFADSGVGRGGDLAGNLASIRTRAIHAMDHICGNEDVYYSPLTKLDHAMPAATVAHSFRGQGLNTHWSIPDKRSAFVGTFEYQD